MTAYRIVTEHGDLDDVGQLTHNQLDDYVTNAGWVIVSGSTGPVPSASRRLKAGGGISIVDTGPGNDIIVSATTSSGSGTQIAWVERPSGLTDGVNVDFLLSHPPLPPSALMFFLNGVMLEQGSDSDYTIVSGSTVHLAFSYLSGSVVRATYPY